MKIVCPSCQAQYEVPEVVLTSRRKMRCARCGSEWVPGDAGAPEPVPAPPVVAEAPAPFAAPPPAPAEAHEEAVAAIDEPDMSWLEPEPIHQAAPYPEPAPEPEPEPKPAPRPVVLRAEKTPGTLPDPAAIVVPPRAKGPPVLAWAFSVMLVAGLVAAAVAFRAPIMKAWPPSVRVYAAIGMEK